MTDEVKRKILYAIQQGNYREVAAKYAGICPATLRNHLRKKDPESVAFLAAIQEAEAEVEITLVGIIRKLAEKDLKAGTWYLSHKFPGRWADRPDEIREALKILKQIREQTSDPDSQAGSEAD